MSNISPLGVAPVALRPESPSLSDWKGGAALPSEVVHWKNQVITSTWEGFRYLLNLFLWVTGYKLLNWGIDWALGKVEKKFELSLYEEVVLSSSHRHLSGAPTSSILRYFCSFLEREKEIPAEVIGSLKQATSWSERLETIESSWWSRAQKRAAGLESLSKEVSQKIISLKAREFVLIPGGVDATAGPKHHLFYRVEKTGEGLYRLELLARDPVCFQEAEVQSGGKERILAKIAFHSLTHQEIAAPLLWQALFSIYLKDPEPSNLSDRNQKKPQSPLGKVLASFKDRQEEIPLEKTNDYKRARSLARIPNLWAIVHGGETGTQKVARRKLRLHLETLFHYFQATHKDLGDLAIHRVYLQDGMRLLSQTVLHLKNQGYVSVEEERSISAEFQVIQEAIEKSLSPPAQNPTLSWFASFARVVLAKGAIQKPTLQASLGPDIPSLDSPPPPSKTPSLRKAAQPVEIPLIDVVAIDQSLQADLPLFTRETVLAQLRNCLEQDAATPLQTEHRLILAMRQLPEFVKFLHNEEIQQMSEADWSQLLTQEKTEKQQILEEPNHLWKQLSIEERFKALQLLTEISKKLNNLIRHNGTRLPDRFDALALIGMHSEYLARLNPEKSNLTWRYGYYVFNAYNHTYLNSHQTLVCCLNRQYSIFNSAFKNYRFRSPIKNSPQSFYAWSSFKTKKMHELYHCMDYRKNVFPDPDFPVPILNALSDFFNMPKDSPYLQCLRSQGEQAMDLFGFGRSTAYTGVHYHRNFKKKELGDWGLPIHHPSMQHVALEHSLRSLHPSQEEIVDAPRKAIKSFDPGGELTSLRPPENLSSEPLRDLLLAIEDGNRPYSDYAENPRLGTVFWNILGLIEQSPEIFKVSDHRAILEIFFIHSKRVSQALELDPKLPQDLPKFFKEQIEKLWKKKEFAASLFLVKLAHTLKFYHQEFADLDFKLFLDAKVERSLREDSELKDHRYALVSASLWYLQHQTQLSSQEAREYLKLSFFLEHEPAKLDSLDPVIHDEIQRAFRERAPSLLQQLGDANVTAVLDEICQLKKIPLPQEAWSRQDFVFRAGEIEMDFSQGTINDRATGNVPLPTSLLRSSTFQQLFPHLDPRLKPRAKIALFAGGIAYGFLDKIGIEWRIEIKNSGTFFYKKERGKWLQYLKPEDFQFPSELSQPLPPFIQRQAIFASVENPSEWTSYDRTTNKPQLNIHVSSSWWRQTDQQRVLFDDLRPANQARQKMQISTLSLLSPPFLHPLFGLDQSEEILIWSQGGKIREVELPNLKLQFQVTPEGVICTTEPFQGYHLEKNPARFEGIEALPSSLVLTHPSKGDSQLLVPHFQGGYLDTFPSLFLPFTQMGTLSKWFAKKALAQTIPSLENLPKFMWHFNKPSRQFWTFALPREEHFLERENRSSALLDLIEYALHQSQINPQGSSRLLKQALESFQRLDLEAIEKGEIDARLHSFFSLAMQDESPSCSKRCPETIGSTLRIFLMLHQKFSFARGELLETNIADLTKAYLNAGKHIDGHSALSAEEKEKALKILNKVDPSFLAPSKAVVQKKFFRYTTRIPDVSSVMNAIPSEWFYRDLKSSLPPFSKQAQNFPLHFPRLYTALQSPPDSFAFEQIHYTLKALPLERSSPFTDFMEMLFDLKKGKNGLALPSFPDAVLGHDHRKLQPFLESLHHLLPAQPLEEEVEEVPKKESPFPLPVENSLDLLEARLKKPSMTPPRSIHRPMPHSGLFLPSEIDSYFSKSPPPPLKVFDIKALHEHPNPAVQVQAKKLDQQLAAYQQSVSRQEILSLSLENAQSLAQSLQQKIDALERVVEKVQAEIDQAFERSRHRFTPAEILAGVMPNITRVDLKIALLQGDFASLAAKLRGVSGEDLKTSFIAYLEAKTRLKHAQYSQRELSAAREEELLNAPATIFKLHAILTRSRGYSIQESPELLVLEETLGFFMDEKQIGMAQNLLNHPSAVAQAITGSGKTSVISVLLGLMKANGTNLVTLRFLDPLFPTNSTYLQKTLSQVMKKKVVPLLFSTKTPLVENGTSLFQSMYEKLLRTTLEKGCVVTNRKSIPLLEAKFLALLYKATHSQSMEPIDREHLYYLAKILKLMRERQECIYDEHDKALYPREELHLALGNVSHPPPFAIETIKAVFDIAFNHPHLGLPENAQAEKSPEERSQILREIGHKLAEKWEKMTGIEASLWEGYFLGQGTWIPPKTLDPTLLDQAALTKDLLITYLPITLSHAAHGKYDLSEDGVSVIPCAYSNQPNEGSQFYNVIERLVYSAQYFYQKGVSPLWLKQWVQKLIKQGEQEMDREGHAHLEKTSAQRVFGHYFEHQTLPHSISEENLTRWCQEIAADRKKISRFLNLILADYPVQKTKVSMDGQTEVSMSKASAGLSATEGCELGLHPQFQPSEQKGHDQAQMLTSFMQKINGSPFLHYSAAHPPEIVAQILKQKPDAAVFIDGAGALLGISPEQAAQKIREERKLPAIAYFDSQGHAKKIGNEKTRPTETGQYYPNAQSRGADVRLSTSLPAVLLASGRQSREVLMQTAGRLRHPSHPLTLAVSEESGIHTLNELLIQAEITQTEENSDNLYRSEMAKVRNAARTEMLQCLIAQAAHGKLDEAILAFKDFQSESDLLISEKIEDLETPGSYFALHSSIQRKDQPPAQAIQQKKEEYQKLLEMFGLQSHWLDQYNPQLLENQMPPFIWNNLHLSTGHECQVEVEQQTQVEQQTELQVVNDLEEEPPLYLPWLLPGSAHWTLHFFKTIQPIYDRGILFTENHLPLNRKHWAPKIHHRKPHDRRQNRLHYVRVSSYPDCPILTAIDILEFSRFHDQADTLIYDTVLKRFCSKTSCPQDRTFLRLLVQLKFEDGQIQKTDYSDEEWEALTLWLTEHRAQLDSLRHYISTEVLKNRPYDQQVFPESALAKLMQQLNP